MSEPVSLARLAERVPGASVRGEPGTLVSDITHDSRAVRSGTLFVAVRGLTSDGHEFVAGAVQRGATAVAVDHELAVEVPQLIVPHTRRALAPLSACVFGDPSRHMHVIGVTGTNGKTTVAHMLESIARGAGLRVGIVGTVGARIAGSPVPVPRTTPEASDLQRLLAQMVEAGCSVAAIEVSSHALELNRADAVEFRAVGFTNLSQDHLDFHRDMDAYYRAKAQLFTPGRADVAVINVGDPAGKRLAEESGIPVRTVGTEVGADYRYEVGDESVGGSTFSFTTQEWSKVVTIPMAGAFNVTNAAVAAGLADVAGFGPDAIVAGLGGVAVVPGRWERVDEGHPFAVVVDYAHTPEAVAQVIESARRLTAGRVIVVVGAGGDRDREKRPKMGAAASAADLAVITSDNPRSEDPESIVRAVAAGAEGSAAVVLEEPDRRAAIQRAVAEARPGDVVLVLGKGHETGQEIAGIVHPFDDRAEARAALNTGDGR